MNERFFALPQEKQQAIINAGYRVFSQNSYKKSPMSEIAKAAGISKSLLFHYFTNKKELYLFLWETSGEVSAQFLKEYGCYEQSDLFEIMKSGLKAKVCVMKEYPDLSAFVMKAYYEKDEAVCRDIQKIFEKYASYKSNAAMMKINPGQFAPGIDLKLMYQEMYWASEGYLWEKTQSGNIDVTQMEQDFNKLIDFWKKIYSRKEG